MTCWRNASKENIILVTSVLPSYVATSRMTRVFGLKPAPPVCLILSPHTELFQLVTCKYLTSILSSSSPA